MYGGRLSLTLSLIVVILETVLGVILGGIAGYFGKWVDTVIMRIIDIFNCIPSLPLMLIIGSILQSWGVDPNAQIYYMMIFLTLLGWTGIARIVRGQILTLREQEFMVSATARGLSTPRKIFRHLVPNVIPQLIVSMTLGLGSVILMEASLSFMGLGVPLTVASWGGMVNAVQDPLILINYPNLWVPPGICIRTAFSTYVFSYFMAFIREKSFSCPPIHNIILIGNYLASVPSMQKIEYPIYTLHFLISFVRTGTLYTAYTHFA